MATIESVDIIKQYKCNELFKNIKRHKAFGTQVRTPIALLNLNNNSFYSEIGNKYKALNQQILSSSKSKNTKRQRLKEKTVFFIFNSSQNQQAKNKKMLSLLH